MKMGNDDDKFIIRGCYSCRYWERQAIPGEKNFLPDGLTGLNGRYDFRLEISENDFYEIYPWIVQYKRGEKKFDKVTYTDINCKGAYLVYLMENGFVSYINERYAPFQIKQEEGASLNQEDTNRFSSYIVIDSGLKGIRDLADENKEQIENLKNRYKALNIKSILVVQQNTEQYFQLLERHITSCYRLNQQSDTRGFVKGIMKLLDTVIGSMEIYKQFYDNARGGNKFQIAEMVADYIREAVYAIDNYVEHIRNNNMQSLHTPNYNIESNMGMEKILIGYGEYLSQFISLYRKNMDQTWKKSFYPIIVPDLQKQDISVEVLFPEGASCIL